MYRRSTIVARAITPSSEICSRHLTRVHPHSPNHPFDSFIPSSREYPHLSFPKASPGARVPFTFSQAGGFPSPTKEAGEEEKNPSKTRRARNTVKRLSIEASTLFTVRYPAGAPSSPVYRQYPSRKHQVLVLKIGRREEILPRNRRSYKTSTVGLTIRTRWIEHPVVGMEMENTECRLAVDVEAFVCEDETEKNSTMRASIGIEDVELCLGGDEMEEKSPARESIVNKEDAIREPSVGMEFETEQALYLFYKEYARRVGFSVTKRSTRYSKKDNSLIAGLYVCSRQGFKVEKENIVNPRPVTRVGCKAMIKAKRMDSKKWKIFNFVKEHNHELSPGNVYSLRSHKKVPKSQKNVIRKPQASRIETENIVSSTAKQSNGINNSGPTEKQRRNPIEKEKRKSLAGEDAQAILKHCMRMHVLNPAFYYAVEVDEEQQPRSVFWVDARSRTAFTYFGDVVTFDTAYLTNRYNVPLALFVGVNHHGQSVLFGCALLADETKESFVWLFKTWLAAMSGQPPKALITDQDRAIKAAITEVFPETHHRLCLWHVLKRVAEKLGYICRVDLTFIDKLHNCVYDSLTIDEFEMRWYNLIKDFNLGQHPWVLSLYKDRQLWVPVYLKDTFFAGMSSSHPHEIIDSFFDAYVSPKTTLKEFINKYEIALENRYKKEVQADLETSHTAPSLRTPSPFEKQAASIYTREIFKKFQVEVFGMSACSISFVQLEGAITTYIVKEWEDIEKPKGKDYSDGMVLK